MYRADHEAALIRASNLERENEELKRRLAARTARGRRILRRLIARNAKRYLQRRLPLLATMAAIAGVFSAMHVNNSLHANDSAAPESAMTPPTDAGVLPTDVSDHGMPARLMCGVEEIEGPMCRSPRLAKPSAYRPWTRGTCGPVYLRTMLPHMPPRPATIAPLPSN